MNVSIATVAKDVGTTVTGIQLAITLYTLVMAAFMITGGKIGQIIGRRRAFMIGCVVYGVRIVHHRAGPLVARVDHRLVGSRGTRRHADHALGGGAGRHQLRRVGAAKGLRPDRVGQRDRSRRRTARSEASARPTSRGESCLPGRWCWSSSSWRSRHGSLTHPAEADVHLDPVGTLLSAAGLGLVVFGVIRSGTWGFVLPKPDAPQWLGTSPVVWLMLGGGAVLTLFVLWESRRVRQHKGALVDPAMLRVPGLQAGLTSFFFQYLLQAGLFFVIPLFLSVALGLSAVATGVRLLPLSIALLAGRRRRAQAVPQGLASTGRPHRVRAALRGHRDPGGCRSTPAPGRGASPGRSCWPASASAPWRRNWAASPCPRSPTLQSGEVGGVQNTLTNLGASIGTALAGTVLIAVLTTTFLGTVASDPAVPAAMASKAQVELSAGIPFVSDNDLSSALAKANVPDRDGRRHRGGQRLGPDQRAPGLPRHPGPARTGRTGADPSPPDRPARGPADAGCRSRRTAARTGRRSGLNLRVSPGAV